MVVTGIILKIIIWDCGDQDEIIHEYNMGKCYYYIKNQKNVSKQP